MFNLGIKEIIIIVLVILALLGYKQIPRLFKKTATVVSQVKDVFKK